jgi:hypothetical protein
MTIVSTPLGVGFLSYISEGEGIAFVLIRTVRKDGLLTTGEICFDLSEILLLPS